MVGNVKEPWNANKGKKNVLLECETLSWEIFKFSSMCCCIEFYDRAISSHSLTNICTLKFTKHKSAAGSQLNRRRETIKTIKWNEQLIKAIWPTYCRQFQLVVIHSPLETLKWVELSESRVKMTVEQMKREKKWDEEKNSIIIVLRECRRGWRMKWITSMPHPPQSTRVSTQLSAWWKCELLKS